jgi:hypothetical protein
MLEATEVLADSLAERLQRLEAAAGLRGMDADALPVQGSTATKSRTWPSSVVTVEMAS